VSARWCLIISACVFCVSCRPTCTHRFEVLTSQQLWTQQSLLSTCLSLAKLHGSCPRHKYQSLSFLEVLGSLSCHVSLWALRLYLLNTFSYFLAFSGNTTVSNRHLFNGPLSGPTWVSWYQKGKANLDFAEARDSEWQWHQLGHMQVCTSLHTDNHASTPLLSFLQAGCPSWRLTASKHWRHKHWRHVLH